METVFRDVAFGQRLAFQNVVSSRAKFHYTEMAEHFDRFAARIAAKGCEAKGPLFYSLNNAPTDEMVDLEMFLPIHENTFIAEAGLRFHSYFEVFPLLRGIVKGDFESQTEWVYAELLATLEANNVEINCPFFHVFHKDPSPHALVFVGYRGPSESDDDPAFMSRESPSGAVESGLSESWLG
jgi:effector-binding domain-containing protein